jgi:hypothetical protein
MNKYWRGEGVKPATPPRWLPPWMDSIFLDMKYRGLSKLTQNGSFSRVSSAIINNPYCVEPITDDII